MIVTENQGVVLHTYNGIQLAQFTPSAQASLKWTRTLREVSACDLTVPTGTVGVADLVPWLHWMSVWDLDARELLWTGPILKVTEAEDTLAITSRDISSLLARTRTPITKAWEARDPSAIARELWASMIELHNLNVSPIARVDPEGDPFDFDVTADSDMLDKAMDDLVGLGLRWSVVSGVPILGPAPTDPVATLGERDFIGANFTVVRDGALTYNDVLLRGADYSARARVDLGGLNLQTLVSVDDMFGISNVDRAVKQYARHTASIRSALTLPGGVELHPDAPITIDDLIPSARFVIEARGIRVLMELEQIEVTRGSGELSVSASFESITELPELADTTSSLGGVGGLSL
ncbi:minor tail protein [Gordonia phage Wooper]|nr:minor tail protein [Gordonia phage Wooper]